MFEVRIFCNDEKFYGSLPFIPNVGDMVTINNLQRSSGSYFSVRNKRLTKREFDFLDTSARFNVDLYFE